MQSIKLTVSSNFCKPYFFFQIYVPFFIPCLVVFFFFFFFFFANAYDIFTAIHKHFTMKLYTHVSYIQNINAHEVLSWQSKIFHISRSYLFLNIYDHFSIPCLAVIFAFCKYFWCFYWNSWTFYIWQPCVLIMYDITIM